jgi:hypothetical protein
MADWGKACGEWQLANPDKDLLTELCALQTNDADSGGSNPPTPPPKPPGV